LQLSGSFLFPGFNGAEVAVYRIGKKKYDEKGEGGNRKH
jgi:hypothetical protein